MKIEYKGLSIQAFKSQPLPLSITPFCSSESASDYQEIHIVLLIYDQPYPSRKLFNNILKSISPNQHLIIAKCNMNESNSYDSITYFLQSFQGYKNSPLTQLQCPWRIWHLEFFKENYPFLKEMHFWLMDLFRPSL